MTPGRDKKPALGASLQEPKRVPRIGVNPESHEKETPVWQFRQLDPDSHSSCRSWRELNADLLWDVHSRLRDFETMTWIEIRAAGSHFLDVASLSTTIKNRLVALKLIDLDQLYSLRLTGRRRIVGIREGRVLKILWWDPDHQVCPSPKKHT